MLSPVHNTRILIRCGIIHWPRLMYWKDLLHKLHCVDRLAKEDGHVQTPSGSQRVKGSFLVVNTIYFASSSAVLTGCLLSIVRSSSPAVRIKIWIRGLQRPNQYFLLVGNCFLSTVKNNLVGSRIEFNFHRRHQTFFKNHIPSSDM